MLHPALEPYRNISFIRRVGSVLKKVDRELKPLPDTDYQIEVISSDDASRLRQLFTFQLRYDANQWLTVNGTTTGRRFRLTLPFRNGVTLPYMLEIPLGTPCPIRATLEPWLTSRGRWFCDPLDYSKSKQIRQLRLPGVGWTHVSGGLKFRLERGGLIESDSAAPSHGLWTVYSAYQGFITVRPRVVKYLKAASRLETLLQSWNDSVIPH